MIMIFVFDLDDTICATDEYSQKYIANFFVKHNLPYKKISDSERYAEAYFDWDRLTALKWYKEFGDQMALEFPCKSHAKHVINSLYDAGHTIINSTARATDWHTEPEKITLEWLKQNGIKYTKIYIGREDKEKVCEKENADVFIDDDIAITSRVAEYFASKNSNCGKGSPSCGGKVFLTNTAYNANLVPAPGVVRVNNLQEMLTALGITIQNNF
jgi:uncharacterized HAD superfamily protein